MILQHLQERHVNLARTRVWLNEESNQAYFPCFNLLGQLIGYQKYNPLGVKKDNNDPCTAKYYICISDLHKYAHAWGFDTLHYRDDLLFVTEGIFDAIRLHNLNLPAVAVLSCGISDELAYYLLSTRRLIVGLGDNDEAGRTLRHACHVFHTVPDPYKDLGEMPDHEVELFVNYVLKNLRGDR